MTFRPTYIVAWGLLLSVMVAAIAPHGAYAQGLVPSELSKLANPTAQSSDKKPATPEKLRQSLDVVISTLEDDDQRQALLDQLKTLRKSTGTNNGQSAPDDDGPHGLLGALASSFNDFGNRIETQDTPLNVWLDQARAAGNDMQGWFHDTSREKVRSNLLQTGIGLLVWVGFLVLIIRAGHILFTRRDWPLILPPEPRPWLLLAHFMRRILPTLLTFLGLLVTMRSLDTSTSARAIVLVVAYVALCGRMLTSVVDVVISLFTSGHRRVAVAILHRRALKPLFVIGVLVAFGDAISSERMATLMGATLSSWLSETTSLVAALLSGWLVLRMRRPVQHLIRNRPYAHRQAHTTVPQFTVLVANLWHIPILLIIVASILAIVLSGGNSQTAFSRAVVCAVVLVLTLALTSLLYRQRKKASQRTRRSNYFQRLSRFGYTLMHSLIWVAFTEICARIWGFSVLGIGDSSALNPQIVQALTAIAVTAVLAWLFWIVSDTALERVFSVNRRKGAKATARTQTVVPMLRNTLFFTIVLIASIVGLANLGVNVTPLLAGAGIIGLAVGFGAQNLVQDLITGVFILIEDSLSVGDFVEINNYMGTVEGLNLRTVRLRDLDGVLHFITFSHISSIHNMSRQFGIALLKIRIPHDFPIDDAITLMKETAEELRKGWRMARLIRSPLEMQGIHAFEDGCPILRMRMRTAPEYQWDVSRAFNLLLKQRMEKRYLSLGAPRISVHMEAGNTRTDDGDIQREQTPAASDSPQPDAT